VNVYGCTMSKQSSTADCAGPYQALALEQEVVVDGRLAALHALPLLQHLDVAAQVKFESKCGKRFIICQLQALHQARSTCTALP